MNAVPLIEEILLCHLTGRARPEQRIKSDFGHRIKTKLPDGRLIGPFAIQLHIPAIAEHFIGFATSLLAVPGLSPRAREVAINVVGAHTKAAYETSAHQGAAKRLGFSAVQLEEIYRGTCPSNLAEDEKIAFEVATELLEVAGPLRQDLWDRAVEVLGKGGSMVLIQYVGLYQYVSTILNGFDAQVPEGGV